MKAFVPYVRQLEKMVTELDLDTMGDWALRVDQCLDGEPGRELRRAAPLPELREMGAFFTGSELSEELIERLHPPLESRKHVYLDPTCGAGDLLLAVARQLPLGRSVRETVDRWGARLAGYDKSKVFIRATKARLVMLALRRHGRQAADQEFLLDAAFPMIRTGNALRNGSLYCRATSILMNPPFSLVDAPLDCSWAQGTVNAAALFTEAVLEATAEGTRIVAILPDVLRSGDRYQRWREMVQESAYLDDVSPHGLFDKWADVHVFIAALTVQRTRQLQRRSTWVPCAAPRLETVGTHFEIHIGPVVPHRHKEIGTSYSYIHARALPAWGIRVAIRGRRKFNGAVFRPPFVVVRRTSRPDDRKRAVPTIILGKRHVAVENHLIVLLPKDGSLEACNQLVRRLRNPRTDTWLNRRIRCRHLTVSAIAGMPWWDEP